MVLQRLQFTGPVALVTTQTFSRNDRKRYARRHLHLLSVRTHIFQIYVLQLILCLHTHHLKRFWRVLVQNIIANVSPVLTIFNKSALNGFLWLADTYHVQNDMFIACRIFSVEIKTLRPD